MGNKPGKFNRRQALENRRFLAALARTGNTRLAARELGYNRSTFAKRRARSAAFAAEWDAALAAAHARLNTPRDKRRLPTAKGELPHVVRLANGRLQLRDTPKRRIDDAARQRFLAALSATANVRLSARAAGFAHASFYRLRDHDPAFAREMRMALTTGYDRVELALVDSFDPESCRDDGWRVNDLPPIPPMSPGTAIQLMVLHHKTARLWAERPDCRRRRGEDTESHSLRLHRKWRAAKAADREGYEVISAIADGGAAPEKLEHPRPDLPALEQVTGWSKAVPPEDWRFTPARGRSALFGGWTLEDWDDRQRNAAAAADGDGDAAAGPNDRRNRG